MEFPYSEVYNFIVANDGLPSDVCQFGWEGPWLVKTSAVLLNDQQVYYYLSIIII